MSTMTDDINDQIQAGRKTIERSLSDMRGMEMPEVPRGVVAAGMVTAVLAIGIVGWMLFRSRRRRPLIQRLQDAIPDSVRDRAEGLRAQVRRAK